MNKDKEVIYRGKRSQTMREVKSVENLSKNLQSFLEISPVIELFRINNELLLISKWAYNWKMLFNPNPSKPVQEVLFLRKKKVQIHPTVILNNNPSQSTSINLVIQVSYRARISGEFDSRKDSYSIKFE